MSAASEVMHHLRTLKDTKGTLNKKAFIMANWGPQYPERQVIVKMLFNKYLTYGIAQLPGPINLGRTIQWPEISSVLDRLATRELSGNAAKHAVQEIMGSASPELVELTRRLIRRRPDCGVQAATVNACFPGTLPEFNIMLAHSAKHHDIKYPCIAHQKLDGVRVVVVVMLDGHVIYFTRTGHMFASLFHLNDEVKRLSSAFGRPMMFDGEVVGPSSTYDTSGAARGDDLAPDLKIQLFDCMPTEAFTSGHFHIQQEDRIIMLDEVLARTQSHMLRPTPWVYVHNKAQGDEIYDRWLNYGHEGVVYKDPKALYVFRRNAAWIKRKNEDDDDLFITAAVEGTGNDRGLIGSLTVDYNGKAVDVGIFKCTRGERKYLWDCHQRGRLVGRVAEFSWHEVTPDGSLRHARYHRVRDDEDDPGNKI